MKKSSALIVDGYGYSSVGGGQRPAWQIGAGHDQRLAGLGNTGTSANYADNRLKASEEELLNALAGAPCHHFIITEVMAHIDELNRHIQSCLAYLLQGLALLVYITEPASHSRHRRNGRGDVTG